MNIFFIIYILLKVFANYFDYCFFYLFTLLARRIYSLTYISIIYISFLANELKENDLNALKYLKRVEYERIENTSNFTLRFHFEENPFFKNSILKKTFFMHDDETPLKSEGTEIDWKQGFNFTKKIVKKVL